MNIQIDDEEWKPMKRNKNKGIQWNLRFVALIRRTVSSSPAAILFATSVQIDYQGIVAVLIVVFKLLMSFVFSCNFFHLFSLTISSKMEACK